MYRYSAVGHGSMVADRIRVAAYTRALEAMVRPGSVVLEIGTGTGLFAIRACQLGAARVYAIEADDIIEAARLNARANGCSDRIRFLQGMSTRISLPERADLLVSDLRGVVPYHEQHIATIADARARLLKPGAPQIPASDRIFLACIEAAERHEELVAPWRAENCGVELPAARDLVVNAWRRADFRREQLRTEPAACGTLDYAKVAEPDLAARVEMPVVVAGPAHGLCLWFETTLADDIGFSSAPGAPPVIYGQAWFPWPDAVPLAAGDVVHAAINARLLGDDYHWAWETEVRGDDGRVRCRHRQSNLLGEPLSADTLRRRSAAHVAQLGDEARIDRLAIERMEQGLPLGEVAREIAERFPARFARPDDALAHVGELSLRYGS